MLIDVRGGGGVEYINIFYVLLNIENFLYDFSLRFFAEIGNVKIT